MAPTLTTTTDVPDDTDLDGPRHPTAGPVPCWPRSAPAVLLWD